MEIMPLTIINIFAVMEIIGLAGDCHDFLRSLAMTNLSVAITGLSLAKTIYFLAMIMAKSLFSVLGIILILAFYLIEKLKNKFMSAHSVGEGEQK